MQSFVSEEMTATSSDSKIVSQLLQNPSKALLRKFGSLGYSLLLRLQSEISAIEKQSGQVLMSRIGFQKQGATEMSLRSDISVEEERLVIELQNKLTNYYTLLELFEKAQSYKKPHPALLETFTCFLTDELHADIKDTPWADESDLMGPFTNHLQQGDLLTIMLINLFNDKKHSPRFGKFFDKLPNCIRRQFEDSEHPDQYVLSAEGISNWFSKLAVIIVPTIIVAPMFALYAIPSTWGRMAGLWGFAIIFATMTRLLAGTNSDVIFATNAAFCAVLVVFVGSALS